MFTADAGSGLVGWLLHAARLIKCYILALYVLSLLAAASARLINYYIVALYVISSLGAT